MASTAGDIGASKEDVVAPTSAVKVEDKTAKVEDEADVPDPDEDDLDDLDELLEEFTPLTVADSEKAKGTAEPSRPVTAAPAVTEPSKEPSFEDALTDDDFAKQLQAGMADLLGEIETTPEMQAQFESIFKELSAAASTSAESTLGSGVAAASSASPPPTGGSSSTTAAPTGGEASFQETIRKTMERMQSSGEQATAAAAAEGSDDLMAELLKQMQSGGGLDGEGNEEEFSKMLLGMMEQLTNKEILYEPMRELHEKFPEWLQKNGAKTPAEDLKRYEEQQALVKEIVAKFEEPTYSDSNTKDREYIVERMQKMQSAGSPPPDLVGDMPSTQDALNMPDESCNPQ